MHSSLPAPGRGVEALARLVEGAEAPFGFGPRRVGAHPLGGELRRAQLEVQADLLVHLARDVLRPPEWEPEEAGDPGADLAGAARTAGHRLAPG
ncbi:hypothetical protein tb265_45820 [Gemmatimonadetes bacterium T265]|nr:hypothetical protein tb265_45820 [Gemmatimonadetes bacterium T265]